MMKDKVEEKQVQKITTEKNNFTQILHS